MINWRPKGAAGWNQLHLAASRGDIPSIAKLIDIARKDSEDSKLQLSSQRENRLDIRTQNGDTALHIALKKNQPEAARKLIQAGCDVHALGGSGESALHIAASRGMISELQWLVESFNLDIHALTSDGSTCVHMAAMEDRCDTLRLLYSMGAKLDVSNNNGDTPLHAAAKSGSVGAVIWLLEKEPGLLRKVNKANKDAEAVARDAGRTEAAASIQEAKNMKKRVNKSVGEFQKLLARGENLVVIKDWLGRLSETEVGVLIDSLNTKTGSNAFLEACAGGDVAVCKYLYSAPGKRELVNAKTGATALQIAAGRGHLGVVNFLLDDLEVDPSRADAKGLTPIQEATKHGHMEIVKVLKENEEKRHSLTRPRTPFGSQIFRPGTPSLDRQPSEISDASSEQSGAVKRVAIQRNSSGVSDVSSEPLTVDEEVINILKKARLSSDLATKLAEQGFDTVDRLLLIMEDDLTEMGMSKGHRRALLQQLDILTTEKKAAKLLNSSSFSGAPEPPPSPLEGKQVRNIISKLNSMEIQDDVPVVESSGSLPTLRVHVRDLQRPDIPHDISDNTQVELVMPSSNPREPNKVFVLARRGNVYSCSCAFWKIQPNVPSEKRTCEHLNLFRGEKAETLRLAVGSLGIVSKQVELASRRSSSTATAPKSALPHRSLSSSWVTNTETLTTSPSGLSESNRQSLREIRRTRSEQQFPEVPAHFVVRWNELHIEQVIGQGSFGIVRVGTFRGMQVAVKELKVGTTFVYSGKTEEDARREEVMDLKREAATMARVSNHVNVVPFVGVVLEPTPSVVMEYMPGGSVEELVVVRGERYIRDKIKWYAIFKMIRDAAAGVLHLHRQGVIHRDLSARNLLVDKTGAVRVADFGFARIKDENLSNGYTISQVGPIKWMAPEALLDKRFSEKTDVFAFGVTMWEILAGERPWAERDSVSVGVRVCSGERMELPRCPNVKMSLLVGRCWAQRAEERPIMEEVLREVDAAWRSAGGHLVSDPSGGVAALIKGPAFTNPSRFGGEEMLEDPVSRSNGTLPTTKTELTRDDRVFRSADQIAQRGIGAEDGGPTFTASGSDEKMERDVEYDDFYDE